MDSGGPERDGVRAKWDGIRGLGTMVVAGYVDDVRVSCI